MHKKCLAQAKHICQTFGTYLPSAVPRCRRRITWFYDTGRKRKSVCTYRDCERAIKLSTEQGESIVNVDIEADESTFYAHLHVFGVDRRGITFEISQIISEEWGVNIDSMTMTTKDSLFDSDIHLEVRSAKEINSIIKRLESVLGVEEVRRVTIGRR